MRQKILLLLFSYFTVQTIIEIDTYLILYNITTRLVDLYNIEIN